MKKILLLQTGGTIAMDIASDNSPRLDVARGSDIIYEKIPELSEIAHIETICPFFKDSSDVGRREWKQLIECITQHYKTYDGFVILHGTDTMAFTASALSFGLQNLGKPVVLTGSQVPMKNIRSDARRNLVNATEIATMSLPEVVICFNDFVYRGNRCTKMSIGDFDAFASPNFPPLAQIGLNIERNNPIIRKAGHQLISSTHFSDEVSLLKIYPGFSCKQHRKLNWSAIRVILIEAFGSGNFPLWGDEGLLPFFEDCVEQDVKLVFTSQAPYDAVDLSKYESGRAAAELGAIGAGDMTTEAALTKIMYILATKTDAKFQQRFKSNIAGEITP